MPHKEYQSVVNKLKETRAEVEQYKAQLSTALNECLDTVYRENSLIVALNKKNAEVERLNKAVDVLGKYPGGWDEVFMASYETAQKLRAENERMRAALEVYADTTNWIQREGCFDNDLWILSEDGYVSALKALGETK